MRERADVSIGGRIAQAKMRKREMQVASTNENVLKWICSWDARTALGDHGNPDLGRCPRLQVDRAFGATNADAESSQGIGMRSGERRV